MTSVEDALTAYLQVLEQSGSLTPKVIVPQDADSDAAAAFDAMAELSIPDDLRRFFAHANGYDDALCDELDLFEPVFAWGMFLLGVEDSRHHYASGPPCLAEENPDYWPLGFVPILWDGSGNYVVVNCRPGSPTYGAVYDMCEGVGCNRVSDSIPAFLDASAREVVSGLRKYSGDGSETAVDAASYLALAAPLFGHSAYFSRPGRMGSQIVDWK
jgi:cell wall assembly regulator SMI1